MFNKILVANRGEISVRLMRAVREMGAEAVAVYPADDRDALHVRRADEALELPGEGVTAYLDGAAIVEAAVKSGCTAVHPGYGFLSENDGFAQLCVDAGLMFIGPTPAILRMMGDKTQARAFAVAQNVPVMPGTSGATSLDEARQFAVQYGAVVVKALAGGGGRGMRVVTDPADMAEAYSRCRSEARAAFGNNAVYVERLALRPRHIEIQVIGDGRVMQHLGERNCSIQRYHQKLIEVAPSPGLCENLRGRILDAALRLAQAMNYRSLGTFEFLIDGDEFFFIEANPRLQVEHTVTEEVTGVDLVGAQLRIAAGASLADLGLSEPPRLRGFAIQARINLETLDADGMLHPSAGTISNFALPSGPGVRVDTYGYVGYRVNPRYDSLIAKVIGRGDDFPTAAQRCASALAEFDIGGVATNLDLTHAIVTDADFVSGQFDTSYVGAHTERLLSHRRPAVENPSGGAIADKIKITVSIPTGAVGIFAPMSGVLVSLAVAPGDMVPAGATLAVLEAMKIEHLIRAPRDLVVEAIPVPSGASVGQGEVLAYGTPVEGLDAADAVGTSHHDSEDWSSEVAEIQRRRELARAMGGVDKVERQHGEGKLTARERIDMIADAESFHEIGALTGFASYDENGKVKEVLPTNFIAGTARIDGRKITLGVDDFTRRGGSGDAAIHAVQIFLERYARRMRLPVVRLLDGQSGGGSVKMARDAGYTYIPINPGWDAVVDNMSLVPVVAAALGPTVGLGAARFVMSHLSVLVEGSGQVFTAGPPVVFGGTGEKLTKDELGGANIHRNNGIVERIVHDEITAFTVIRDFLSYLPSSVFDLPPIRVGTDPVDRREEFLLSAIPRNKRRPYLIAPILDAIFDTDSVFTYAEYGASTVTALARLDGHPVGIISGDPMKGAAMSVPGAQAIGRLVDLCETFHLPIISLTDQAGVNIGSVAESQGTIRAGARAIASVYQARVPQAEIIMRRVYGVGGAGIVNRHEANRCWAWPSGDWGSLPARGGIEAAFRAEIETSANREATIDRIAIELDALSSPFRTAEHFGVQDLIDPRDTRALLCDWVRDAYHLLPELVGRPVFGCRP